MLQIKAGPGTLHFQDAPREGVSLLLVQNQDLRSRSLEDEVFVLFWNLSEPSNTCLSSPSESVKFCKLLSIVLSTWLTASGFIHLVSISSNPLMLLVRMNVFSVKTGANLPSSCLHHCSQREIYLFTSFGWVFLHSIFLTSMYLLHSQYPCVFSQLSKPALREGFNKLIHLRYKQYVKCILYHAFPAI